MQTRQNSRIAITGIGLCTPLGPTRESSWKAMRAGRSAVRWLTTPHWTDTTLMPGAPVCLPSSRQFQHSEPLVELALTTAQEALFDAQLDHKQLRSRTVGVVFGNSKGGLHTFSRLFEQQRASSLGTASTNAVHSNDWLDFLPNRAAAAIGQLIGGYGPIHCPVAACATGLAACQRAAELIRSGDCDIVIAGSGDASLHPLVLSSFRRLGVVSREELDAAMACRPFDRNRSGFAVGEGAACLILERLTDAQDRKAVGYAEWIDGLMLSDSFGLTQQDPDGTSVRQLLGELKRRTDTAPDHINLHGTGTQSNDRVECQAIREVFGSAANQIDCCSLKGGLGHLLGAAGSVELAATALSIRDQVVPPTVNLRHQDEECPLQLTALYEKPKPIEMAWKISMGFGGHIAGACLRRI